jgi:GntR family transcriptional regulator/MocR family aminotransferase
MARSAASFELPVPSRRGDQQLHNWLYESIRDAVRTSVLQPGIRLPSSRAIAAQYGIARGTVVAALERLVAEGFLQAHPGAGTFVTDAVAKRSPISHRPRAPKLSKRVLALPDGGYPTKRPLPAAAFRANQPALDRFPWELWHRVSAKARATLSVRALMDQHPSGYAPLREEIARHVSAQRGLRVSADQVMVFSGMQQAIGVAACTLADPGEGVVVEEPGYPAAADAFAFGGLKVIRVPVDEQGLDITAARNRGYGARIVYLTPAHQAPLGTTMTLSRRLDLLRWADERDLWIFEDDYDGEFRFHSQPLPALQSLDENGRVLYAATFTKTLFSSLRLAYLILPPGLVEPFAKARWIADRYSPVLEQAALARFLAEGHYARHAYRMRKVYSERHDTMLEICERLLGKHLEVVAASTGLQTPAWLRQRVDDQRIAAAALSQGVELIPLSAYYRKPPETGRGFLMGFATVEAKAMEEAAIKLRRILEEND